MIYLFRVSLEERFAQRALRLRQKLKAEGRSSSHEVALLKAEGRSLSHEVTLLIPPQADDPQYPALLTCRVAG